MADITPLCGMNIRDQEGFIYTCGKARHHKGKHRHNSHTTVPITWTSSSQYPTSPKGDHWINGQAAAVVAIFVIPTLFAIFLLLLTQLT